MCSSRLSLKREAWDDGEIDVRGFDYVCNLCGCSKKPKVLVIRVKQPAKKQPTQR